MASVSKHFIARHGVAVGATPTTVISDTGAATITNLSVSGSLQTAFNLNSQILTNANIDSGTIDGATIATSNITVGTTKTLDVSGGTLTLANDQISGDKIHGGTISGPVTITAPYIATIYSQAATSGILTLRSNSTDTTTGYVSIPMTTASTTVGTGALVVAGGLGVTGQSTLSNVVVTGNLTVNGTTSTVNSTTVTIDDPVFTLGGDTAPGTDDSKDRGIEFRWHTGAAARVGFFGFDDSTGKFTFIPDATNTSEVFTGTKGTLDAFLSASDLTAGTIATGILGNSSLYIGSTQVLLNQGTGTLTTLAGLTSVTSTSFVGALTGNASTATTLQTTRAINGVNFDGSAAITVPVNVTDDTTTNATYYPSFAQATSGNTAHKVASTKLTFNPSTGTLTATAFSGTGTSLTSLTAGNLTGTIPSAVLGNSTVYVGTTAIALNRASLAQALTGITSIDGSAATLTTARAINGVNFNGSAAITVPVNSTDDVATAVSVYPLWTTAAGNTAASISTTKMSFVPSTGTLTATAFVGALTGNATTATTLATARTINGVSFNGSANIVVTANTTNTLTRGTYLTGSNFNGSAATSWAVDATSANTASKVVARDVSGNFAAGTITAALTGTASGNLALTGGTLSGDLAIDGGDLTSAATTFNLLNATVTTLNVGGAATTISIGSTGATISTFNGTAAIVLPVGDDAARPGTPTVGMIRYSSTAGKFEGYTAGGWGGIGGGSEITDDTSTDATYYPGFVTATTGAADILKVSSTKLTFNPSTGTLASTNFNSLSDARYKKNVVSIDSGVETINQLRGVGFDWIDSGKASFGVIAQELEKILPALVEETPVAKTVNYTGIIAFLIKAVQELDARVKELEK